MEQPSKYAHSSFLEREAADYFKIDPTQVHILNKPRKRCKDLGIAVRVRESDQRDQFKGVPIKPEVDFKTKRVTRGAASERVNEASKLQVNERSKNKKDSERLRGKENSEAADEQNRTYISSTSSTNSSLPSISSSPSVSPSLLCPHLSLNNLLSLNRSGTLSKPTKSPHTIGLCENCRLNPPPNIHSPLSPIFNALQSNEEKAAMNRNSRAQMGPPVADKRGRSKSAANERRLQIKMKFQDDSLDYCLEPRELKKLELAPSLRHRVEYMRKNSIESGRVLKIYKNGLPYDKPLHICIMRNEFTSLNHLLDFINGRQAIPMGARYLFHLDGQLVYSLNELKHGHRYIVSGSRSFDHRANKIIKDQQLKESSEKIDKLRVDSNPDLNKPKVFPLGRSKSSLTLSKPNSQTNNQLHLNAEATIRSKTINSLTSKSTIGGSFKSDNKLTKKPNKQTQAKGLKNSSENLENLMNVDSRTRRVSNSNKTLQSQENLRSAELEAEKLPADLNRAKSELSAVSGKRKKNVTFVGLNRSRSPAMVAGGSMQSILKRELPLKSTSRESLSNGEGQARRVEEASRTNEIGVQVNGSIDGFLIDLPIALPGERNFLRKGQGGTSKKSTAGTRGSNGGGPKTAEKQIVTIAERQLSSNEMGELRDLDHGDHHSELRKKEENEAMRIDLDELIEAVEGPVKQEAELVEEGENSVLYNTVETIAIGQEISAEEKPPNGARQGAGVSESRNWRYQPGRDSNGRSSVATPTERPISQSEANEMVRARVITPSPSLSTVGDDNSLTMSYSEMSANFQGSPNQFQRQADGKRSVNLHRAAALPVRAKLVGAGSLNAPSKTFQLTWVNGFSINDKYPENSVSAAERIDSLANGATSGASSPAGGELRHQVPTAAARPLLSPKSAAGKQFQAKTIEFQVDEKFHNWLCHSREFGELIYPAGCLIVLWSKSSNEQRYYAKHTSGVSAICLSSLDSNLVASSQQEETMVEFPINASVHLWSLKTLETLKIIEDDLFRGQVIFSLKLKNSLASGCELSVATRDSKRLWLYAIYMQQQAREESSNEAEKSLFKLKNIIKLNKLLQPNQIPLTVCKLSNVKAKIAEPTSDGKRMKSLSQPLNDDDIFITFGRKHFQLWLADRQQSKIRLMQPQERYQTFVGTILKATCSIRLCPLEFIFGDSDGNILMVLIECKQTVIKPLDTQRYIITSICLNGNSLDKNGPKPSNNNLPAITSLARITGSLFVSADANCALKFWKLESNLVNRNEDQEDQKSSGETKRRFSCRQLNCVNLPREFGFICTILISNYNRKLSMVELYVISTSNVILYGTIQLKSREKFKFGDKESNREQIIANSSLSVIYEGHETSVLNLVADVGKPKRVVYGSGRDLNEHDRFFFTCSIDCKICKWNGKNLVWKSILPSACASLAVHPIGQVLAIGSADGTVYILNKMTGLLISYFPLTPVCINCLAYSQDGSLLAAGCANGSIFILPVYESGLRYKKVSIFQSPQPVVSLQFSLNNQYILTSITRGSYQELILWDLPNFRYMRDKVKLAIDKIDWFDSICSGSEDVRAIWENANLSKTITSTNSSAATKNLNSPMKRLIKNSSDNRMPKSQVVNLSCHRLIRSRNDGNQSSGGRENLVIASDTLGYIRLFKYPCYDINQAFFELKSSSKPVNCCRFLAQADSIGPGDGDEEIMFASSSLDGSICLWTLIE